MIHTYASESKHSSGPVYLDCNATAPMEPAARDAVVRWLTDDIGNAGSRTHEFGLRAKKAVQTARSHVSSVVGAEPDEVLFTSGATESNNIAILGLARHGESTGRRHIVSTAIEHKAVLEPLEALQARGFEVTLLAPSANGAVTADAVRRALRPDTLLVSVMQVNNETGVLQPVEEIAATMDDHDAYLHTDAAQGFGKDLSGLRSNRIDLISVSAHKVYGPLGIGALIARRRAFARPASRRSRTAAARNAACAPAPCPSLSSSASALRPNARSRTTVSGSAAALQSGPRRSRALEPLGPARSR